MYEEKNVVLQKKYMRSLILFLAVSVCSQWIYSQTWDSRDYNDILLLVNSKEYDKAHNKLEKIKSNIHKKNQNEQIDFFCLYGYAYLQSGDFLSAISELDNAMRIVYEERLYDSKIYLKVAYLMADVFFHSKKYKEAESVTNVALARCTGNWQESAYAKGMYHILSKIYKEQNGNRFIISQIEKESQVISDIFNISPEGNDFKSEKDNGFVQDSLIHGVSIQDYFYGELTKALSYTNSSNWDLSIKTIDEIELSLSKKGFQHNPLLRLLYVERARLYFTLGNIYKAQNELLKAKRIFEQVDDCTSIGYADCINLMGTVYQEIGLFYYSTLMFNLAKATIENIIKSTKDVIFYHAYLSCYDNLARNYYEMGDIEQATQTWKSIISDAQKEKYDDILFSSTINYVYAKIRQGDNKSGIDILSSLIKDDYGFMLKDRGYQTLLMCSYLSNDKDLLIKTLQEYIVYIKSNLKTILLSFSENERNTFWEHYSGVLQLMANATCWKYSNPETREIAYNTALYTKGIATHLPNLIKNYVKRSKSERVQFLYNELIRHKKQISNTTNADSLNILSNLINSIEKDILQDVDYYKDLYNDSLTNFRAIREKLSENEIAIEYIIIPEIISADSIEDYYGALIVKHNLSSPICVKLCKRNDLDHCIISVPLKLGRVKY